jgi:aminoglycoside phosphotransferase (APT) family kinase protein
MRGPAVPSRDSAHPRCNLISDDQAAAIARQALNVQPKHVVRQTLTQSGNDVFRADLADGRSVVLRTSPRRGAFAHTARNLEALRRLDLPVQNVLAAGTIGPPARESAPSAAEPSGSFIVLDWLAGRDLGFELPTMSREDMTRVAETVTDVQRRVATLPRSTGFGWAPIGRNADAPRWTEIFGPAPEPTAEGVPHDPALPRLDRLRARLASVRRRVEPHFDSVRPICFLDDLTTKNVLIENGRLTGLIDFDEVCYGDPLMSVGSTLAHLATDVGPSGQFYGEELVRLASPGPDALRAIRFYAALWTLGFASIASAAESAGDGPRATALLESAEHALRLAEAE